MSDSLPEGHTPLAGGDAAVADVASGDRKQPPIAEAGLRHMFDSLRYRDFRILWIGQLSWYTSLVTEHLARNWLVWSLTGSALSLAFINLISAATTIAMTLPAGVAADRFNKKTILVWCQLASFLSYLAITTLVLLDWVQLWHVYVVTVTLGVSMSFNLPTRQSLVPRIVPQEMVMNAFSLNQVAMSSSRSVAPAIAGLLIAWWPLGAGGAGTAFAMGTASFTVVVVTTFMLHAPQGAPVTRQRGSALGQIGEGLAFVAHSRPILAVLIVAAVTMAFGMSYMTLLPVLADDVFDIGAQGYGLLTTVTGIGALLGGIGMASMGNPRRRGLIFLANSVAFGLFNLLLGVSAWTWIGFAFLAMFGLGAGGSLIRVLGQTLALELTPPHLQGRVMAVYHLDRALMPLGAVMGGVLTDAAGAPLAFVILGTVCIAAILMVGVTQRTVRQL